MGGEREQVSERQKPKLAVKTHLALRRSLSREQQWVWCYYGDVHPIEGGNNRCFGETNDFIGIKAHYYSCLEWQFDAHEVNNILRLWHRAESRYVSDQQIFRKEFCSGGAPHHLKSREPQKYNTTLIKLQGK